MTGGFCFVFCSALFGSILPFVDGITRACKGFETVENNSGNSA